MGVTQQKSIYLNSHFQTHITLFLVVSNYAVAILFIRNFIQYDALGPKLSDTSTGVTLILAIGGPLWLIASNGDNFFFVFSSLMLIVWQYTYSKCSWHSTVVVLHRGSWPMSLSMSAFYPSIPVNRDICSQDGHDLFGNVYRRPSQR